MTSPRIDCPRQTPCPDGPGDSSMSAPEAGDHGVVRDPGPQIRLQSRPGLSIAGGTRASSETEGGCPPSPSRPLTSSIPPMVSPTAPTATGREISRGRVEIQTAFVAVIYLDLDVAPDAEGKIVVPAREKALRSPAIREWQDTTQAAARALRDVLLAPATELASGLIVIRQIADCEPELLVNQPPRDIDGDADAWS